MPNNSFKAKPLRGSPKLWRWGPMKTILLLVAIALIAIVLMRSLRASRHELSGDGQVIEQLRAAGSKMDSQHLVEFFLYFPSKDAADRASNLLFAKSYAVTVEPARERGPQWLLLAKKELTPIEATLLQIRQEMTALASAEGGEYDGWGTGIVR